MKRKYKLPPVKRITICASEVVADAMKKKAYALKMPLSQLIRLAVTEYNPGVKK
jgi:hypothetical protein